MIKCPIKNCIWNNSLECTSSDVELVFEENSKENIYCESMVPNNELSNSICSEDRIQRLYKDWDNGNGMITTANLLGI